MSKPIIYEHPLTVKKEDLDELNHVNNMIYFAYLQEAAIAHWHHQAPKEIIDTTRWVVRKHEIEYLKSAHLGDELTIHTWVENFSQISSERHYEIRRNKELIVKAQTLWIALDTIKLRPKRIPIAVTELFFK